MLFINLNSIIVLGSSVDKKGDGYAWSKYNHADSTSMMVIIVFDWL